jgi:hypothetical protein
MHRLRAVGRSSIGRTAINWPAEEQPRCVHRITGFLENGPTVTVPDQTINAKRQVCMGHRSFVDPPANGEVAPRADMPWGHATDWNSTLSAIQCASGASHSSLWLARASNYSIFPPKRHSAL